MILGITTFGLAISFWRPLLPASSRTENRRTWTSNTDGGELRQRPQSLDLVREGSASGEDRQTVEVNGETGCSVLPGGGESIVVWAFDAAPSHPLADPSDVSNSNTGRAFITRVLCGNTNCMQLHRQITCVHAERLLVRDLTEGTPLERWGREHVLHKIVSAHHYEYILQVALQLAALYKYEGSLLARDSSIASLLIGRGKRDAIIGSSTNCKPSLGDAGIVGASLSRETLHIVLTKFAALAYSAASSNDWPFQMDWGELFSTLDCRVYVEDSSTPLSPASLVSRGLRYGTLTYNIRRRALLASRNPGMNLGDEMQGLAGLQFMPYLDALVERDEFGLIFPTQDIKSPMQNRTLVFANAWYGSSTKTWPPPDYIDPVLVAIHTESDRATISKFNQSMLWMRKQWPVGVRDVATMEYFTSQGVPAFVSNCMTTTIVPLCPERNHNTKVLTIDLGDGFSSSGLVPSDEVVESASHKSLDQVVNDSPILRYKGAFKMLRLYACDTKVVLTNRLHSALPTAASGTPVMWVKGRGLPGGGVASRVKDYYPLLHKVDDAGFDWRSPQENPQKEVFDGMRNRLQVMAYCHHEAIADASTKFGTVPPHWASRLSSDQPLCPPPSKGKDGSSSNSVRIATVLDAGFLKRDVILPSFVKSLAQFNKDPIIIYVLTMKLTEAQQCLVRYIVSQPLHPESSVHIVPADDEMATFAGHYIGLGHISVATMARLALPKLLPCVSKLIWLDIDTLILRDLRPLWEVEPKAACGIAARRSFSPYMSKYSRGPEEFKTYLDTHFKTVATADSQPDRADSFNAGVMVINMDKWRGSKEFAAAIEKVALRFKNDDQVTLNYFCHGAFTRLPGVWNIFNAAGLGGSFPDPVFRESGPEEWGVIHWTSNKKPWSKSGCCSPGSRTGKLWEEFKTTTAVALSRRM